MIFGMEDHVMQERLAMDEGLPAIQMSRHDAGRLDALLADYPTDARLGGAGLLLRELLRADVVASEAIAPNTVTMHSVVTFCDQGTGNTRRVTLVYPAERASLPDALSVLAPLGAALIGLSEGQAISYEGIDGRTRTVTVLKVHSQPAGSARGR